MNILAPTIYALEKAVRTTLNIDDELLAKATKYLGLTEKTAVVHEALRALIQREAARQLASRGGSDARATADVRRRSAPPSDSNRR
jgi:Arc/MetJ family transcription regulator